MPLNTQVLYGHLNEDGTLELRIGALDDVLTTSDHAIAEVTFNPKEFGVIERFALREFTHIVDSAAEQSIVTATTALGSLKQPAGTPAGEAAPTAGVVIQKSPLAPIVVKVQPAAEPVAPTPEPVPAPSAPEAPKDAAK